MPWPERVVTLMTTLALSPNSAGGAHAMTSMDWIDSQDKLVLTIAETSGGIWVLNNVDK